MVQTPSSAKSYVHRPWMAHLYKSIQIYVSWFVWHNEVIRNWGQINSLLLDCYQLSVGHLSSRPSVLSTETTVVQNGTSGQIRSQQQRKKSNNFWKRFFSEPRNFRLMQEKKIPIFFKKKYPSKNSRFGLWWHFSRSYYHDDLIFRYRERERERERKCVCVCVKVRETVDTM